MSRADIIYLDHAAGTPLLPEVQTRISEWLESDTTNPSSIHGAGRYAAASLDEARTKIAQILGSKPSEILFTSGATEANNLAIVGAAEALKDQGRHIITCSTEHPSVLESCDVLEKRGFQISYLPCDENGDIDLEVFKSTIRVDTILASFMFVNNETGLIHPIDELAKISRDHNVKFHCDAVQAFGHIPVQVSNAGIDSMALSGHKLGAPAGVGVLYVRKGHALSNLSFGGSQEQNMRAGTQNHLGALAMATAMSYHAQQLETKAQQHQVLNTRLRDRLNNIPGVQINRQGRCYTPHILSCSFQHVDGEALFIRLDMQKIAVSNGAACSSGSQTPSHVLTALGINERLAQASIRISLGVKTTEQEIDDFCEALSQIIDSIYKEAK